MQSGRTAVNEALLRAMRADQSLTHNNFWNRKLGADVAKLVGITYDRTPSVESGTGTMTSPDTSKTTTPATGETPEARAKRLYDKYGVK